MASNPVLNTFDREVRSGQYAGFDAGRQGGYPSSQGGYQGPFNGQQGQMGAPYGAPAPQVASERMTLDDVVSRSLNLFGLLIVVAGASFFIANRAIDTQADSTALGLWAGGGIIAFVLSLVIAFRKKVSVPLILAYTLFEGVFLGAISAFFNNAYPGIVAQAVLATMCVFGGMLVGYKTGLIKVTERSRRIFMGMLIGYSLFALINFVLVLTHVSSGYGIGGSGPLGIAISLFAVALASYSLAIDFDTIQRGVEAGVPRPMAWTLAYGLMVSVVWLYVEMLRLFGRMRD